MKKFCLLITLALTICLSIISCKSEGTSNNDPYDMCGTYSAPFEGNIIITYESEK